MKAKWIWRLLIGFCFAIPMGAAGAAVGPQRPTDQVIADGECKDCHLIIQSHWGESAHADATTDPAFQAAWAAKEQDPTCLTCHTTGYDADSGLWQAAGVSCSTCHYPVPNDHPNQIMPTDISSRRCGDCHLDTYSEWETSSHGKEELTCVKCHDSHGGDLKAGSVQAQCQACHNEEVHFYGYTAHAAEGLLCIDCHLRVNEETPMGEGHGQRLHTFEVSLSTCARCHTKEMHFPVSDAMTHTPMQSGVMPVVDGVAVDEEPQPASPFGFALIAGLVGMAFGLLVAPWIERWYRRIIQISDNQ